jgi:hypothetical protein
MFSCTEGWYQNSDSVNAEQIAIDVLRRIKPNDYTTHHIRTMKRFLKDCGHNEDKAISKWEEWVQWRLGR